MSNGSQRIAVVIGAASGIGWATAQALASQGDRVIVADRNADGAQARAAELGEPHTAATVDVTDEDLVQWLFEETGQVDVVVNCAGFSNVGLITDMPVDQFRDVIDVCLTGAFIVAKHAGRNLRPGGALVSISSLNGRQPAAGMSAYCAAKAGLSMLTQVAALELGPRGIRVNAVARLCPHAVDRACRRCSRRGRGVSGKHGTGPRWHTRGHRQRRAVPLLARRVVADR